MENNIDILVMQEIEIEPNFNCELLSIPGYRFESEKNDVKKSWYLHQELNLIINFYFIRLIICFAISNKKLLVTQYE